MDDARCTAFFSQPTLTYHRQYEALRSIFLDGESQADVAARFDLAPSTLRQLVYKFRLHRRRSGDASVFFAR